MAGSGATPCGLPGLEELLRQDSVGLACKVEEANAWCEQMGAKFLSELTDEETFPEFVEALQLKTLEQRRLRKALAAVLQQASPTAGTSGGYAAQEVPLPADPASMQSARSTHTIFVKNTFIDLDDSKRPAEFARAKSVPVPPARSCPVEDDVDEEEEEEDADEAPGDEGEGACGDDTNSPAVKHELPGLYKTVTLDGYETLTNWDWARQEGLQQFGQQFGQEVGVHDVAGAAIAEQAEYGNCNDMTGAYAQQPFAATYVMVPAAPEAMMQMGCMMVPIVDRFTRWPEEYQYEPEEVAEKDVTKKNVLERAFSVHSTIYRVRWTVDARKLKSKDTEAVSPQFSVDETSGILFKMLLRPRITSEEKCGASFKRARGRGVVELRCVSELTEQTAPSVTFRIFIGSPADPAKQQQPRGPVHHDFAQKPLCGLPRGQDEWNFSQVVDKTTQTFVVVLEVLSGALAGPSSSPGDE